MKKNYYDAKALAEIPKVRQDGMRLRFEDLRTEEGKRLNSVMEAITADLPAQLSGFQSVILANLRSKLIVLMQISAFLDTQLDLVKPDGTVMPVVESTYLKYSDAIRRDLEALAGMASTRFKRKPPKLSDILAGDKTNKTDKRHKGPILK